MKITIRLTRGPVEVEATEHTVEGCRVVAHRDPRRPRAWAISEPRSGLAVAKGETRKEALENARLKILRYGKDLFETAATNTTP